LLPTVLALLGLAPPADQLYQGRSLYACQDQSRRRIYLNTYRQYGIIAGGQALFGDRQNDQPDGSGPGLTAYSISNQGSKTLFAEDRRTHEPLPPMRQFDQFQANLLRNYAYYCKAFSERIELSANKR
jgi:hypothetical protein